MCPELHDVVWIHLDTPIFGTIWELSFHIAIPEGGSCPGLYSWSQQLPAS